MRDWWAPSQPSLPNNLSLILPTPIPQESLSFQNAQLDVVIETTQDGFNGCLWPDNSHQSVTTFLEKNKDGVFTK